MEGTVRTLTAPETTTQYALDSLNEYVVREITVDGTTVTPVEADGTIDVENERMASGELTTNTYTVAYTQGEVDRTTDVPQRTDTITNSPEEIIIPPTGVPTASAAMSIVGCLALGLLVIIAVAGVLRKRARANN